MHEQQTNVLVATMLKFTIFFFGSINLVLDYTSWITIKQNYRTLFIILDTTKNYASSFSMIKTKFGFVAESCCCFFSSRFCIFVIKTFYNSSVNNNNNNNNNCNRIENLYYILFLLSKKIIAGKKIKKFSRENSVRFFFF